jgi:sec-independent protein translocase protein TatB
MFDIGFWELVVVAIVALLVVGPERLPDLARDAGKWISRVRKFINNTRREIETELQITESKEFGQQLSDLDDLMRNAPDQDLHFKNNQKIPADNVKPGKADQE